MLNRWREYLLYIVGADIEGGMRVRKKSSIKKTELGKLKKQSVKPEQVEISTKKIPKRDIPEEYEIDNLLMQIEPELPKAEKFRVNKVILTDEQRDIYHFRFMNYSDQDYDLLRYAMKNNLELPEKFTRFQNSLSIK